MMKKHSVWIVGATLLSACQGAYNTSTGPAQPVLDIHKAKAEEKQIAPVTSGGILMRRTSQEAWEAPKREVDVVRDDLAQLKRDLSMLYTSQEKRLAEKFDAVDVRVKEMRIQEMKDAAQDAELLSLVKEKFDTIEKNIRHLKEFEASDKQQQEALLSALDQKFSRVEERMDEIDLSGRDMLSNQRQEVKQILESLEIETLRRTSVLEQEVVSMQEEKERLLNALDQKFTEVEENQLYLSDALEETNESFSDTVASLQTQKSKDIIKHLELQAAQEEKRRQELLSFVKDTTQQNTKTEVETAKRKAILEQKILVLKDRLKNLEQEDLERETAALQRQHTMQQKIDKRLVALEEEYSRKVSELESAKAKLDGKLAALNEKEVMKLHEGVEKVTRRLDEIAGEENVYRADLEAAEAETDVLRAVLDETEKEFTRLDSALVLRSDELSSDDRLALAKERDRYFALRDEQRSTFSERKEQQKLMQQRLDDIRNKFRPEVDKLIANKSSLEERLKEADVDTVMALRDEREDLFKQIEGMLAEHEKAIDEAKVYRTALEERRYDIERVRGVKSNSDEQEKLAALETPNVKTVGVDIVSSIVTMDAIEMRSSDDGGVVSGVTADNWIALSDYKVVVHDDDKKLRDIVNDAVKQAEPFVGPWEVKWKLRPENSDVLSEKFSLDVETDFEAFASYLSNYMKGYRGFPLTFNMFNSERVLVITDEQF